ncbi:hypothetical protein [Shinella fusca]|uniref:Uncharacterized protein n=1 Tax=Shinella fusca TaxID=544480 RepID=A0A7W8DSD7_9HYPH|nr:hypothetical protein [Shinella fusca]MBB5040849.1 hypothetical protein [Shinella fusca]
MGENVKHLLQQVADEILALKLHPATSEEYDAGYIGGRNDAFAIVQEAIDNLPPEPALEAGLSFEEQKAQGQRCACNGSDDYCPCQNVPDAETRSLRDGRDSDQRKSIEVAIAKVEARP